eukprot:COSAG03_NODE_1745_length_3576_cov_4.681910_3_plen_189_part_00
MERGRAGERERGREGERERKREGERERGRHLAVDRILCLGPREPEDHDVLLGVGEVVLHHRGHTRLELRQHARGAHTTGCVRARVRVCVAVCRELTARGAVRGNGATGPHAEAALRASLSLAPPPTSAGGRTHCNSVAEGRAVNRGKVTLGRWRRGRVRGPGSGHRPADSVQLNWRTANCSHFRSPGL